MGDGGMLMLPPTPPKSRMTVQLLFFDGLLQGLLIKICNSQLGITDIYFFVFLFILD